MTRKSIASSSSSSEFNRAHGSSQVQVKAPGTRAKLELGASSSSSNSNWIDLDTLLPASHLLFHLRINLRLQGQESGGGEERWYPQNCEPAIGHASKFPDRSRDGHYHRAVFSPPPPLPSTVAPDIKSRWKDQRRFRAQRLFSWRVHGYDSLPLPAFIIRPNYSREAAASVNRRANSARLSRRGWGRGRGREEESTPTHK